MKRLYKIIILFFIIFFIGIYLTVKSINNSFVSEDTVEVTDHTPNLFKLSIKG